MSPEDRERLVRVEEGVLYLKKKVDTLPCTESQKDLESLKQTQRNIRRGVWGTCMALITAGITYLIKG